MCIAIVAKAGMQVPDDALTNGWISNSDGGGFAYCKDGKVFFQKGFMKLKEFMVAYKEASEANKDSPFLVHFRIRSMGSKDEANTHPYPFKYGVIIHNGTISGTTARYNEGPSDTKLFVDKFGEHLSYDFVVANKYDLNNALDGSKFAMLYNDGRYAIINEQAGKWDGDVWYSNHSYCNYKSNVTPLVDYSEWD